MDGSGLVIKENGLWALGFNGPGLVLFLDWFEDLKVFLVLV